MCENVDRLENGGNYPLPVCETADMKIALGWSSAPESMSAGWWFIAGMGFYHRSRWVTMKQ